MMDEHVRGVQSGNNYERDLYGWANEQAALLRARRFDEVDLENVAEEIESLGRSEKRELVSRLAVLLAHLLKWQFEPTWRGRSWRLTIKEQRRKIAEHLDDNPSLRPAVGDAIGRAYRDAVADVQKETTLNEEDLPPGCPYTPEQIFDPGFLPE